MEYSEYREMVQKILDIQSQDWENCFNKLLHKYRVYYSDDIFLDRKLEIRDGIPEVGYYNFRIKSDVIISLLKDFFGPQTIITSSLKADHDVANIYMNFIFDRDITSISEIRSDQLRLYNWYHFKVIIDSNQFDWVGGNLILMKGKYKSKWFLYNWSLKIDLTDNYKSINSYKIYNRRESFNVVTGDELLGILRDARPYLNQTVLYDLLLNQDLLLLKSNNTRSPHKSLYVAIPGSQFRWHNYELMWVFNFYL